VETILDIPGDTKASVSTSSHSTPRDSSTSRTAFAVELWPSPVLQESSAIRILFTPYRLSLLDYSTNFIFRKYKMPQK
jgi:hypothetical protein